VNVSPFILMEQLGFSRGQYSSVMALVALVSMLSAFSTPYWLSHFKEKTLMLTAQALFISASVVLLAAHKELLPARAMLVGFAIICAAFSLGFGVTMSQALGPFRRRAGMASSLLGITQVCTSALYIWLMGALGVSALNMLLVILIIGGAFSAGLILWVPTFRQANHHEEVSRAS
jgi:DHA1 family multidrug resistance protein-like MFS transporter